MSELANIPDAVRVPTASFNRRILKFMACACLLTTASDMSGLLEASPLSTVYYFSRNLSAIMIAIASVIALVIFIVVFFTVKPEGSIRKMGWSGGFLCLMFLIAPVALHLAVYAILERYLGFPYRTLSM